MLTIHDRIEKKRLNGHRIPGEIYLVGSMLPYHCCKFPTELSKHTVPQRGLLPVPLVALDSDVFGKICRLNCPALQHERAHTFTGLMWIPEKYYSHAAMFVTECRTEPVQVRVKRIPANIKLNESFILLAHRKAIVDYSQGMQGWIDRETGEAKTNIRYKPGIFTMFRVEAIEYVVKDMQTLTDKEVRIKQAAGVTFVNVLHDEDLEKSEYDEPGKMAGYES